MGDDVEVGGEEEGDVREDDAWIAVVVVDAEVRW